MNKAKFLSSLLFLLVISYVSHAQIPKIPTGDISKQVMGILDNTTGLTLSADQSTKLKTDNKSFVDQLFKVTSGAGSEDEKKKGILGLKDTRTKFLTQLLGSSLSQNYMGNILKGINPLKSKLGLAALAF